MTHTETDAVFSVSASFPQFYTAAHLYSGIPLIRSIILSAVPSDLCGDLTISVYGSCLRKTVANFSTTVSDALLGECALHSNGTVVLNLEKYRIFPDERFISELCESVNVRFTVSVTVGNFSAVCNANTKVLPFGHVCPEMPPELLATYVLPGCDFAKSTEKQLSSEVRHLASVYPESAPKALVVAGALSSLMLSAKLTYSANFRELTSGECVIRDFDSIVASNNRSMSLTEAALLYASIAERASLRPVIIYLRKGAGSVKVLIGICLSDFCFSGAICESISELREKIISKEIFVFDVLGLLGTEDTDFARNVSETSSLVLKSTSNLVFALDVFTARLCGVRSLRSHSGYGAKDIYGGYESIADAIKRIESNDSVHSLYGFSPYSATSLGLCAAHSELEFGKKYALAPIDEDILCTDSDSIGVISHFEPKNFSEHPRNIAEKIVYDAEISALRNRISSGIKRGTIYAYSASGMLGGEKLTPEIIRDSFISDSSKLSDIVKADSLYDGTTGIYAAVGIVKLVQDNEILYAPCAYVPCDIIVSTGSVNLRYGTGSAKLNRSLADKVSEYIGSTDIFSANESGDDLLATLPDERSAELSGYLSLFENITKKSGGKAEYCPDILLSAFDLSYTMMRECLEKSDGKNFEKYLENGKYDSSGSQSQSFGRIEETLPFECTASLRSAIKCAETDSTVISGVHGTGKKAAAANIIVRAHLAGKDTLVCSKYGDSLDSLFDTFRAAGLDELCLVVGRADKTKKQILGDLERLSQKAQEPDIPLTDVGKLEDKLRVYSDEVYSMYSFGYSLYDCINLYCEYDLENSGEPVSVGAVMQDMSAKDAVRLLEVSDSLAKSSADIARKANGKSLSQLGFGQIRSTKEIPESAAKLFIDAARELEIFSEKSEFARKCLGISDSSLCDVRSMLALGEFFEIVTKAGVDFIPEQLLGTGTYRNAKSIERICTVVEELAEVKALTAHVSDKIASVSCTELLRRWRESENNIFVRNSITHELKKYLPPKSGLRSSKTGELLELLSRHESLETELTALSGEAVQVMGKLWKGKKTDTVTARRAAEFAILADSCSKKMFRDGNDGSSDIRSGITKLMKLMSTDKNAESALTLAAEAFRKLDGKKGEKGLLGKISEVLSADLYEYRFENGILGSGGMSSILTGFCENLSALSKLCEYNAVKKEAMASGLSEFARYAEENPCDDNVSLFRKSIFAAFAKYIISTKEILARQDANELYDRYIRSHKQEKQLAAYKIISAHRERFAEYISCDGGKSELYALRESLCDTALSPYELLTRHSKILGVMYSAIFAATSAAYRLPRYPSTLILLDCEKTDAAEGLPICAHFDKCIFISSPFERTACIMSALPIGIPTFKETHVLCEKNGHTAAFISSLFDASLTFTREYDRSSIKFIKCEGGLFDRNTRANKIEAVLVCESALSAANEFGFENVGIIAATAAQTAEIKQGLRVVAKKYSDERIADIPVRFIGNMGDFSKDCIIFSTAFGKNVYSMPRSLDIFDDVNLLYAGSPMVLGELLCAGKELRIAASFEPSELMTDNLSKGAKAIAALLQFAKFCAVPTDIRKSCETHGRNGTARKLEHLVKLDFPDMTVHHRENALIFKNNVLLYETSPSVDEYDRIILPYSEYKARNYNVKHICICDMLKRSEPTAQ